MPEEIINQPREVEGDDAPQSGQIDWSNVNPADIPFDLIKQTEAFQSERKEATERRLKIKELEGKTEKATQTVERDVPANETTNPQVDSLQKQFEAFQEFMSNTLSENEKTQRRSEIAKRLTAKKVVFADQAQRDAAIDFIDNGNLENIDNRIDKFVSTADLRVQQTNNTGGGNSEGDQDPYNPLLSEVDRKLGFKDDSSDIWSPSFQRGVKGGAVVRN